MTTEPAQLPPLPFNHEHYLGHVDMQTWEAAGALLNEFNDVFRRGEGPLMYRAEERVLNGRYGRDVTVVITDVEEAVTLRTWFEGAHNAGKIDWTYRSEYLPRPR